MRDADLDRGAIPLFSGLFTSFEVVSAAALLAAISMLEIFLFCRRYSYNGFAGVVKS
ncbi:MAG: hypothetical protein LBG43_06740 [Treponema sp.]|nr:hypothetical protein [Treponema sp.]